MKRYLIEEAKCDVSDGGMACGPVGGSVIATAKFRADDAERWLSIVEFDSMPNAYLFDRDEHDELVAEDFDNEEFVDHMNACLIDELDGIKVTGNYEEVFESIRNDPENPAVPLVRFIIALVRCESEDVEELVAMAEGKFADEIDVPVSDVEEDYLDDLEDGLDDEDGDENSVD